MNYIELEIKLEPRDPWADIVLADLAEKGYESFVETDYGLMAYGNETEVDFNEPLKGTLLEKPNGFKVKVTVTTIPQQNWNAVWEADFKPVFVEDYCTILAPFHDPLVAKGKVILIQPQMSFGTGHHQTTYLMTKSLFELDSIPERVLDMGCGTGVLAIVAELLGAKRILAVDIEEWSVENTIENAKRNNCTTIETLCGDIEVVPDQSFGLILANINKNVLKGHLNDYFRLMEPGGLLLLSGFFVTDASELIDAAEKLGMDFVGQLEREEWSCLHLRKRN